MPIQTGYWIESDVNELIKEYNLIRNTNNPIDWNYLASKFNRKKSSIWSKLQYLGYRWKDNELQYNVNESMFEMIDTEPKAYWYGFLFADGNVARDNKCGHISLGLCIKDKPHLEKFKMFLQTDIPIKEFMSTESQINGRILKPTMQCRITIGRTKIVDDLIRKGCIPKKSLVKQFPEWLSPELYPHYIRGYFDGNGTIGAYYDPQGYFKTRCGIISNKDHIDRLKMILEQQNIIMGLRPKHKVWDLYASGIENIKKMYEYLYTNATIWLDRKKKVFDECYNHTNEDLIQPLRYWTKEEEEQLQKDLVAKNYKTYKELALRYNRTMYSTKEKIYRCYKHLL